MQKIMEILKNIFNIRRKPKVSLVHRKKNEFTARMLQIEHETDRLSKKAKEAAVESRELGMRARSVASMIYHVLEQEREHGHR